MRLFKKQKKLIETTPRELSKRVDELNAKLEQTEKELNAFKLNMERAITKIGITRFNPFREIGGDQSFAIALLDENHSGVLITSYYGRELNRVYAKHIQNGASEHELSHEEEEALAKAKGLENPKPKPQI